MSNLTSAFFPVAAQINPQSVAASGTASSAWVNAGKGIKNISAVCIAGTIAADLTFKVEQASTITGTGVKDLGTTVGEIANTADNTTKQFDINPSELDAENGFYFIRLTVTSAAGGAGSLCAGALILAGPDHVS